MRHPKGLSFAMQRKVVLLRDDKDMSWDDIADPKIGGIMNLAGLPTCRDVVKRAYEKYFKRGRGKSKYDYRKCGRKRWKMTLEIERFLIQQLLSIRRTGVCTSMTLQRVVARDKKITLSDGYIRKVLRKKGYRWLPRSQKRKYSKDEMLTRLQHVKRFLRMSKEELRKKAALSIDGTVIPIPPDDDVGRWNHCMAAESHMWRKRGEAALPELAGGDAYFEQVGINRAVPFWGGISQGGCGYIIFHESKKCSKEEWVGAVRDGTLGNLLRRLNPTVKDRPWHLLCDGERFLHSKEAMKAYVRPKISLCKIPARSPDLNPIEKFWSWFRTELRRRDLQDLRNKRATRTKDQYINRMKTVLGSSTAKEKASRIMKGMRSVYKEVLKKRGAAARS